MNEYKVTIRSSFQNSPSFTSVWVGLADTASQARSFAVAASLWGGIILSCVRV